MTYELNVEEELKIAKFMQEYNCGCVVFSRTDEVRPIYTSNGPEIERARQKINNSRVADLKVHIHVLKMALLYGE